MEYNNLKNYMLSSVYTNGGFWIGQYEAGAESYQCHQFKKNTVIQI